MIIESLRQWNLALSEPTHGIIAQLAALQTAGGIDAGDIGVLPATINIGDEATDFAVAQGRPAAGPAACSASIFFESLGPIDPVSHFMYRDARLSLGVRFDTTQDELPVSVVLLSLLVRAAMNSTQWWLRDAPQTPWRLRNGIQFIQGVTLQAASFSATARSANNTYGVRLIVDVRDSLLTT